MINFILKSHYPMRMQSMKTIKLIVFKSVLISKYEGSSKMWNSENQQRIEY